MCIPHRRTTNSHNSFSHIEDSFCQEMVRLCCLGITIGFITAGSSGWPGKTWIQETWMGPDKSSSFPIKLLYYNLMMKPLVIRKTKLTILAFWNICSSLFNQFSMLFFSQGDKQKWPSIIIILFFFWYSICSFYFNHFHTIACVLCFMARIKITWHIQNIVLFWSSFSIFLESFIVSFINRLRR